MDGIVIFIGATCGMQKSQGITVKWVRREIFKGAIKWLPGAENRQSAIVRAPTRVREWLIAIFTRGARA